MWGLFKSKPQIKGWIGYFDLADWWLADFTDAERRHIKDTFQPGASLTDTSISRSSETAVGFLSTLAGWFQKPADRPIACKILEKAASLIDEKTRVLDMHFLYGTQVEVFYKDREKPGGLEKAVNACRSQIALAPKAARAFKREHGGALPSHRGYEQLAIVLEKQGEYAEAVALCRQAIDGGWAGDWQKRIERCEKRIK